MTLTDFGESEGLLSSRPAGAPGDGDEERAESPRHPREAGMEIFATGQGFGGEEFEGEEG